jgi:hypothetical protein
MLTSAGHQEDGERPYDAPPVLPSCPVCQYDLRGITTIAGARCPECGTELPFDRLKFPRNRAEERRFRHLRPLRHWMPVIWSPMEAIVVGLGIGTTIYLLNRFLPYPQSRVPGSLVIVGGIALGHALIVARRRWQVRKFDRQRRIDLRARGGRRPEWRD